MVTRRAVLATFPGILTAAAGPTLERQTELLREASAKAFQYARKLPDFTCLETIHRWRRPLGDGWLLQDKIRAQIGIASGREYYKLLTWNELQTQLSYRQVGGALTEGEFGSLLAEIFHPNTAAFRFSKTFRLDGKTLFVYQYQVPQERATYHLEYRARDGKGQSVVVGHRGLVWIDEATQRVLRIEQTAQIPRGFPLRSSKTVLEFAWFDIAGTKWLMPSHSIVTMGGSELRIRNEVDFSEYRRFTAESSITFESRPIESRP